MVREREKRAALARSLDQRYQYFTPKQVMVAEFARKHGEISPDDVRTFYVSKVAARDTIDRLIRWGVLERVSIMRYAFINRGVVGMQKTLECLEVVEHGR